VVPLARAAAQRLAWGQQYLQGGVAIAEATVGKGKLYLLGPEVMFRSSRTAPTSRVHGIYWGASGADGGSSTEKHSLALALGFRRDPAVTREGPEPEVKAQSPPL